MTAKAVELLAAADALAAQHSALPGPAPRLWREPVWLLTVGVMTVLVVVSLAMFLLVQRSDESAKQRHRIEDVQQQIKSCVDPAGECARRGSEQTQRAVEQLNRATVAVVECADAYDGKAAIDACVQRALVLPAGR